VVGLVAVYAALAWLTGCLGSPHEHAITAAAELSGVDTADMKVRGATTVFLGLFTWYRVDLDLRSQVPSGPQDAHITLMHTPIFGWGVTQWETGAAS